MIKKQARPIRPSLQLKKSRLSSNSKEVRYVLRDLKRREEALALASKADLQRDLDSMREHVAAIGVGVHPKAALERPRKERAGRRNAEHRLQAMRRELSPLYSVAREDARRQKARALALRRHPEAFDTTFGDPISAGYIGWADSVTATTDLTVRGSNLDVIPNPPLTEFSTAFLNQVRFAAVASTPLQMSAGSWFTIRTAHVFTFTPWEFPASAVVTASFFPNALFRVTVPPALYYFPVWHAVPHIWLFFAMALRVDHWLPGASPSDPPTNTNRTLFARPKVGLSGWDGAKTASGTLNDGPSSLQLPPFLVLQGSRVVVTCEYGIDLIAENGANGVIDAISPSLGLNVPRVDVVLNY